MDLSADRLGDAVWHAVYGGDELNVLLVDFHAAPLERWTFPLPGVRSLVHRTVERLVPQRLADWYLSR